MKERNKIICCESNDNLLIPNLPVENFFAMNVCSCFNNGKFSKNKEWVKMFRYHVKVYYSIFN